MKVNIILIATIAPPRVGVMSSDNMTFFLMRWCSAVFTSIYILVITLGLWRLEAKKRMNCRNRLVGQAVYGIG